MKEFINNAKQFAVNHKRELLIGGIAAVSVMSIAVVAMIGDETPVVDASAQADEIESSDESQTEE